MTCENRWFRRLSPVLLAAFSACQARDLAAVSASGVYVPDAGCTVREEGGSACPTHAQLAFETSQTRFASASPRLLDDVRVSCRHSFCGTGSLAFHASFHWREGEASPEKLGEIRTTLDPPVEMAGRQLTYAIRVEPASTPVNSLLAVISRGFHKVEDGPVLGASWNPKGGTVGPENPFWEGAANATSVPVSEIHIQFYLALPVRGGDGTWQGDVYVDEIGWR